MPQASSRAGGLVRSARVSCGAAHLLTGAALRPPLRYRQEACLLRACADSLDAFRGSALPCRGGRCAKPARRRTCGRSVEARDGGREGTAPGSPLSRRGWGFGRAVTVRRRAAPHETRADRTRPPARRGAWGMSPPEPHPLLGRGLLPPDQSFSTASKASPTEFHSSRSASSAMATSVLSASHPPPTSRRKPLPRRVSASDGSRSVRRLR